MDNSSSLDKVNINILMLGLDDAGKTTILYKFKQNDEIQIIPSIGYNVETIDFEDKTFTFWDIGGLETVRVLWKFYTENKAAVLFVVDASNAQRFAEAKEFLHSIMNNADLANAALLIISNKHDKQICHDELYLEQQLELKDLKRSYDIINTSAFDECSLKEILLHLKSLS